MANSNQNQWVEVKKIKFHHRVKNFYYKNLFRKIYTVAIMSLIVANIISVLKYHTDAAGDLQLQNWAYGTIKVTRPNSLTEADGPAEFIIMDRNLGAIEKGTTCSSSSNGACGYHYQWGNNHGFQIGCYSNGCTDSVTASSVDVSTNGAVWNASYDNNGYYGEVFIKDGSFGSTYWSKSSPYTQPNGLWGGASDGRSNNYGLDTISETFQYRQGPCPSGWHVPSIGEWKKVMEYWCINSNRCTSSSISYTSSQLYFEDQSLDSAFTTYLSLAKAGTRTRYQANMGNIGNYGFYWTSTPGAHLILNFMRPAAGQAALRNNGESVRCFKNPTTYNLTFDSQGGTKIATGVAVKDGFRKRPTINPTKTGYMFVDWYTSLEYDEVFDFSMGATRDVTIYARWIELKDLSIHTSNGRVLFTIMDRNLGSVNTGAGSLANISSYGSYYQWGNNHGFANTGIIITSSVQIDVSSNSPSNYYDNNMFVVRTLSPYAWDSTNNYNLWGGTGDSQTNRGMGTDIARRGPCPDGYHVPSTLEWNKARDIRCQAIMGNEGCTSEAFAQDLLLPYAGHRNSGSGEINSQGEGGYYWSSSRLSDDNAYYLNISSSSLNPQQDDRTPAGYSVRCFMNTSNKDIIYDVNGGDSLSNGTAVSRWKTGDELLTPTHSDLHKEFKGWYTTSGFELGSEITTTAFSTDAEGGNVVLYARWECDAENGYREVGGICLNTFQITWKDGNGNTLKTEMIEYGETPSYSGETPTKSRTPQYTYTFNNTWSPEIQNVTNNATYIAQFDSMVNKYNITFVDEDGETVLKATREYDYGTPAADIEKPADPEKAEDRHYIYTFAGWTPAISEVTEHRIYRATYSSIAKEYEITWKDGNGDILKTEWIEYGETPSYSGITPIKSRTPQYTYTFNDTWTPEIQSVTDDATYTAQFDSTVNQYQIRFVNTDGTQLQAGMVAYGDTPTFTNALPNNPYHVFMGWEPDVVAVTTGATYTAKWGEDINENEIYDALENRYRVVVHYIYSRGGAVTGDRVVDGLLSGLTYNIVSPVISHYNADKESVSGIITGYDIEATVIYRPNTDINNNGIADEEEDLAAQRVVSSKKPVRKQTKVSLKDEEAKEHGSAEDVKESKEDGSTIEVKKSQEISKPGKYEGINVETYSTKYSTEINEAYQFSYANEITTQPTIESADIFGDITRIQMAKMLSNYATNVLGQTPDTSRGMMKFNDVPDQLNEEYDNAVTTTYQLGIMGINMENNEFRPNDRVTRAEFATALSRMLYSTADGKGSTKYYEPHIYKLYEEGIMTDTNPDQLEKRGYVMTMLLRGVK